MSHFTVGERQETVEKLLDGLSHDEQITGVLLVGSAAEGFDDRFSDIDLSVVVADNRSVLEVFREWKERISNWFPVQSSFEVISSENSFLAGFLLSNFLELDIGFLSMDGLYAKRVRWKVAFDRSGKLEELMRASWENRSETGLEKNYRRNLDSIWHYITHVAISLARGHHWRALHYLDEVRNRTVRLACFRRGLDPSHFRPVHLLPANSQEKLLETLPHSTQKSDIYRALQATKDLFFEEARAIDELIGDDLSTALRTSMDTYLSTFQFHKHQR
jgi:predicted nucleotidyltransferase